MLFSSLILLFSNYRVIVLSNLLNNVAYLTQNNSGIARRWVFGRSMCWFFGLFYWLPQKVEFLTIATVSIHRLFNLLFPLSTRGLKSARATRFLCSGIWLAVVGAIILDIFFKIPIQFDRTSSTCGVYYEFEQNNKFALEVLWFVTVLVLFLMPIGVTLVVNIAILGVAGAYRMRHTGSRIPSKSAFLTVTLVAWGFICSTFPALAVYAILVVDDTQEIPVLAVIIAWECLTINVWINPFIYTLINNRFREFLLNLVSGTFDKLSSNLRR